MMTQPMRRNTKNRVAFQVHKKGIEEALTEGWPVKAIWATLQSENEISMSYQAFNQQVNKYIRGKDTQTNHPDMPDKQHIKRDGKQGASTAAKGFVFDPNPKKEDLF